MGSASFADFDPRDHLRCQGRPRRSRKEPSMDTPSEPDTSRTLRSATAPMQRIGDALCRAIYGLAWAAVRAPFGPIHLDVSWSTVPRTSGTRTASCGERGSSSEDGSAMDGVTNASMAATTLGLVPRERKSHGFKTKYSVRLPQHQRRKP